MGKPTGFLEYSRTTNRAVAPKERILHFDEFHPPLEVEERKKQGARCMNCGVPFCQSAMTLNAMVTGCPLHNLIPEWNDALYQGNFELALSRLLKTNNFPEFTGRVCPALCEAACTCGMDGKPVTCKENELAIIEYGYELGLIKARIPKVRTDKKIAVIGSGPAGLSVADQLNQRGHNVTVYERDNRLGGLLVYGIPNMKLEKHIIERKVNLLKEEGIQFITNADVGKTISAAKIQKDFDAVILACGAKQPRDILVEGREGEDVYFAVDFLTSTTKSLLEQELAEGSFISAKGKHVVIVGGGDTGNDCVGTCIRHGCASVTQVEMMAKLPDCRSESNPWPQWPRISKTDYGQEESLAVFGQDPRIYESTLKEIHRDANGKVSAVTIVSVKEQKKEEKRPCDLVLIAAGFLGCQTYVPEEFGVEIAPKESFTTDVEGIFACGDMQKGQSLVVWAIAQGRACAKEVDAFLMGFTNM